MKEYEEFGLFWGDSHTNVHGKDPHFPSLTRERLSRTMKAAEQNLDFFPIAYYPAKWYYKKGLRIESWGPRKGSSEDWKLVQEAVAEANKPGEFVTFLGYEWTGNRRRYGDHNVFYLRDYEPLDLSEGIAELYENLAKTDGIAIPHHTGYQVRERGKDWDFFDEDLSPFAEIYSSHGSSEGCNTPFHLDYNRSMGPRVSGGTVQDGLSRGHKFGIIASGDNHQDYPGVWGNGLMAVFTRELTRESLWKAFKKRRVYGVTGDRIKLFFSINGHIMGESFSSKDPANIAVEAIGGHAIDRIEIIRNGRVVHTYSHTEKWSIPHRDEAVQAKLRIQCGWGTGTGLYGFKKVESKTWNGSIGICGGEIISAEPCFTHFGQELRKVANNRWAFTFTTQPRSPLEFQLAQHHRGNIQGAIFEVDATPKSRIKIQVDSVDIDISLEEAFGKARLIPLTEEVKQAVYEQFGLTPDEVDNPDVFWHNAWKMKISKAIPRAGYHAKLKFVDDTKREGESYYYARVSQLNGQTAWSSPIWITSED